MAPYTAKVDTPRDVEDDDFDFEYFSRTYKPLSNLPTPPPSSRNSASPSPVLGLDNDEFVDSALLGPAVHLVNLHPPSASIASPSVSRVQAIVTRAALPLETIALAVCILDSLDSKFSRKWRMDLPLGATSSSKRHTISAASSLITHIDLVSPEVIILTALVIAFKFTEDCQEPTQYYASDWGNGLWTCDQINTTERNIMEHLGYRILPLFEKSIIEDALDDMRRAGQMALREREINRQTVKLDAGHSRSISVPVRPGAGDAIFGLGFQLTPLDTPTEERSMELGAPQ
ncbi:hypothetical protein Daus18300_003506 [Diaporthe australafricana]|uniref:Cyclin N-terminal domain-containing protein n=1 Tax=Diaporthe australafricana TaxID=127596 RepID=A0ABR3XEW3_9PEZI